MILRVFRYSRERDDGSYGVGYVCRGCAAQGEGGGGGGGWRGVGRTVSYDFRLAPAIAAAPTAL